MPKWFGPGEEPPPRFLDIQEVEMRILGERWAYRFLLDEEALEDSYGLSHLVDHIAGEFKRALADKFERESERAKWQKNN